MKFIKKYIENAEFKPLVKKEPNIKEKLSSLGLSDARQEELFRFINHENRPERYPIEDTWNCNEYDDLNSIAIVSFSGEKISKSLDIDEEFKGQKSIKMLMRVIESVTEADDIILDFFAGTCSTAHAVLQLNAKDGGNRRFVMVQLPETCDTESEAYKAGYNTIADIGKERIRRAGKKVLEGQCSDGWNKDIGFRVLKVDSSNMVDVYYTPDAINQGLLHLFKDNIKADRTPEDLLFQVMLNWGVDLSYSVRTESILGKTVFFVDENALVACFDTGVNEDFVKELALFNPLRVIFRDSGFDSDAVKINVEQIFKQLSPSTEVRSI